MMFEHTANVSPPLLPDVAQTAHNATAMQNISSNLCTIYELSNPTDNIFVRLNQEGGHSLQSNIPCRSTISALSKISDITSVGPTLLCECVCLQSHDVVRFSA
jgi:hypothetical protein